jgi:aspartate/methionine/tyrosine aminotransferase
MSVDTRISPASVNANSHTEPLPRLPVLGWAAFAGERQAPLPSVLDQRNVLFTTSGRAAIALALRALGVAPGDRVLVPTYHCPTMIAPVVSTGADPRSIPSRRTAVRRATCCAAWTSSGRGR